MQDVTQSWRDHFYRRSESRRPESEDKEYPEPIRSKEKEVAHYAATHHLYFFTPDTLRALIERAGYSVVEWLTPVDKDYGKFGGELYRNTVERLRAGSNLEFYIKLR
jgi:hypothetical protein